MDTLHTTNDSVSDQPSDNEKQESRVEDMNIVVSNQSADNDIKDDDSAQDSDNDKENAESSQKKRKSSPDETVTTATAQKPEPNAVERKKDETAEEEDETPSDETDSTATAQSPSPSEEEEEGKQYVQESYGPSPYQEYSSNELGKYGSFPRIYVQDMVNIGWECAWRLCPEQGSLLEGEVRVLHCGHYVHTTCAQNLARIGQYRCEKIAQNVDGLRRRCNSPHEAADMDALPVAQHIQDLRVHLLQPGLPCFGCKEKEIEVDEDPSLDDEDVLGSHYAPESLWACNRFTRFDALRADVVYDLHSYHRFAIDGTGRYPIDKLCPRCRVHPDFTNLRGDGMIQLTQVQTLTHSINQLAQRTGLPPPGRDPWHLTMVNTAWMFKILLDYFRCTSCEREYERTPTGSRCSYHPVLLDDSSIVCSDCAEGRCRRHGRFRCGQCSHNTTRRRPLADLYMITLRNPSHYQECKECKLLHAREFMREDGQCVFCLDEAGH